MAFINKKEEVIKLRLTQHGKYLLSTGRFLPDSYAFFDDDIIYDTRYAGVTEHQNESQDRIKEQPRRDTQHVSTGVETSYILETDEITDRSANGEFVPFIYDTADRKSDKVLGFPLSNMALGSQELPRFDLNLFESEIENTQVEYEMMDSARVRIPQLTINPIHTLVRDTTAITPFAPDPGDLVDSETFAVNPISDKIEFRDGSFFEHHPESIAFSLEEANSTYLKENFEIEVFEIVEEGENQKLVPVRNYQELFNIKFDNKATKVPGRKSSLSGFFN